MSSGDFAVPGAPNYPAGPPDGPPPEPTPPRRDRGPWISAAVGLAIAVIVAVAAAVVIDTDAAVVATAGPETTAPSTPSAPSAPSTTVSPSTTVPEDPVPDELDDAAFQQQIDELIAFVEQARGLEFKERPDVLAVADDDFVDRFIAVTEEGLNEDPELIEHYDGIYRALGLLGDDMSLTEAILSFGAEGVLGYYEFEADELVVRGDELTPYTKQIVVHELVHALDDQWFELDRPEYDDAVDEVGFGFQALVEGNAQRIDEEYYASLPVDEQFRIDAEQFSFGSDIDFSGFTPGFLELQFAPYELGRQFVLATLERGGNEGLAQAFDTPPATSEQVIDPDAYVSGEGPIEVPAPPADGEVVEEGIFGQLTIEILLGVAVGRGDAFEAGDGWGGDWFVSWEDGSRTCLRVDIVGDTAADTDELEAGLATWAAQRPAATSELVDGRVRLTTCSG